MKSWQDPPDAFNLFHQTVPREGGTMVDSEEGKDWLKYLLPKELLPRMHFSSPEEVTEAVVALLELRKGDPHDEALLKKVLDPDVELREYGDGLEGLDVGKDWRSVLFGDIDAQDMAQEMLDVLLDEESQRKGEYVLRAEELTPAIKVILALHYPWVAIRAIADHKAPLWSREQCKEIAKHVLEELGTRAILGWKSARRMLHAGDLPASSTPSPVVPHLLGMHSPPSWFHRMVGGGISAAVRAIAEPSLGFRSIWVETDLGRFHCYIRDPVVDAEDGDGEDGGGKRMQRLPPVIVIHGLLVTAQSMLPLSSCLANVLPGRSVIVPDLLGFDFGHSDTRKEATTDRLTTWEAQAVAVAALLAKLSTDSSSTAPPSSSSSSSSSSFTSPLPSRDSEERIMFDVVAHSYGGYVATTLARMRPDLVRRLSLLCPAGHGRYRIMRSVAGAVYGPFREVTLRRQMGVIAAPLVSLAMDAMVGSSGVVRQMLTNCFLHTYRSPPLAPTTQPTLLMWGTADGLESPHPPRLDGDVAPRDAIAKRRKVRQAASALAKTFTPGPRGEPLPLLHTLSKPAPPDHHHSPHPPHLPPSSTQWWPRGMKFEEEGEEGGGEGGGGGGVPSARFTFHTPRRMMRDFVHDESVGVWLHGANHGIILESVTTVTYLTALFLATDEERSNPRYNLENTDMILRWITKAPTGLVLKPPTLIDGILPESETPYPPAAALIHEAADRITRTPFSIMNKPKMHPKL